MFGRAILVGGLDGQIVLVADSRIRRERIVGELKDMVAKEAISDSVHFLLEHADLLLDQLDEFRFGGIETTFVSVQVIKGGVEVSRHGREVSYRNDSVGR